MPKRLLFAPAALAMVGAMSGCGSPSKPNIDLRKQNADLRSEVEGLNRRHDGDLASLRSLQSSAGSISNLPPDRLEKLFTVHGLKFGRLTGAADLDSSRPGDEGLKVHVVPTDDEGDVLKAAGSFVIEAFDLGDSNRPLVGRWTFDVDQSRKAWYSGGLLYEYAFTCPWTDRPTRDDLTLKVTFTDDLTRRQFSAQKMLKIPVLPTTAGSQGGR